jgi:hypothetical protein
LTLLYITALVVSRERFDPIQAMAEQAVLSSVQGMGNAGPLFFRLACLSLCFDRLVTKMATVGIPNDVVVRIGADPIQAMTG